MTTVRSGFCIWLTGLPSSGKTTIARALTPKLKAAGWRVELLDGDEVRMGLSADLGFDRKAREAHAQRVTFVAKVLARNGVIPIVALISPYKSSRARAREQVGPFAEVYITTPVAECEKRDVKGLYKKAREGKMTEFTGVDDPYEAPEHPEIIVDTVSQGVDAAADQILKDLHRLGFLPDGPAPAA